MAEEEAERDEEEDEGWGCRNLNILVSNPLFS